MDVAIFWDTAPCIYLMNRRFGGKYQLYIQCHKSAEQETSAQQVAKHFLKMEVIGSFETLVHILTTRCYIPENY
jgi:hypothetical protein